MVVFRKKKSKKFRGSKTHGWGAMKKHRGAGNRGGRGNAGTGKRGDAMKTLHWKETYFGKHGFKKKGQIKEIKPVNLQYFEENIDKIVEQKKAAKQGDAYAIDVAELGFNKVLGTGKLTKKIKITSELFSSNAEEKIKAAGGEAVKKK